MNLLSLVFMMAKSLKILKNDNLSLLEYAPIHHEFLIKCC